MFSALTFASLAIAQATAPEPPRAVIRHAVAAVEGDSVAVLEARWGRAAARTPPDRSAVLGLATLARLTYRYARAESLYASLDPDDGMPDAAAVYALLGQGAAGRTRGAQRVATDRFERAGAAAERAGDRDALTEALIMLAVTRVRTAGPTVAESLFQRAAAQTGRDAQLQALYHCTHAELLALSFRPAADEAARGAELAAQAGDGRLEAACNHFVAADLGRRGGIWWAAGRFQRVITQRRLLRDRAGLATSLQWRGFMLRSSGWLEDARRDLEEAVSEGQASGNASAEAWALNNLAAMSLFVGDASAAARYADSSAALFAEQGDRYGEAQVVGMRGGIAAAAGDLEGSVRGYRASLALAEQIGDRGAIVVIRTILAQQAMRRRDWAEASRELEAARVGATAGGMLGRLNALQYHRGVLALHTGQFDAAERDLRTGLIRVGPSPNADDGQWDWYYFYAMRLAELYAGRGQLQRAESLAQASMQALDTWRAALSQRELRLQAYQVSEDNADPDLGLATVIATLAAAGRVEPAFHLAERLRARELLDHLARAEGLATADSTRERNSQSSNLGTAATRAEIAAALPDAQTALLEFVTGRGGEPTTVFVLTRDTLHAHVVAAVDSLEPLIDRLTSLLESGAEPRELARTLGARLLDTVLATLPAGITRLVMIPDGALHRVPFEALIMADGRFVVQRYAVGIVPSATVAARLWSVPRRVGPSRILAIADPSLGGASPGTSRSATTQFSALPRLRASRREARLVARFGSQSTVRLGAQASEAWLKQTALPDYRVLHFATHARADEATLSGTAIALAPGDGEDGTVGPGELGRLRLDADLVVLSACRSGGGVVVRGEGIVGLAAPLLEAGARVIALTRWTIGDRQTVAFIEAFYRSLASGQPVADAMQAAKLDAIARGAPPAEWAAFTLVGDPAATVELVAPSSNRSWYWLLGGAALAGLLTGWVLARRRQRPA